MRLTIFVALVSLGTLHAEETTTQDLEMKKLKLQIALLEKQMSQVQQQQQQTQSSKPPVQASKSDSETSEVLAQFGNVVSNFVTILKDPNDTENCAHGFGGMVQGMVNIASIATRKPSSKLAKILAQHFSQPEGKKQLEEWEYAIAQTHFCNQVVK